MYASPTFQFPTGWNSTNVPIFRLINSSMFQFPTGWNSTKRAAKNRLNIIVSIPNGMEFYFKITSFSAAIKAFQFPTGWNSTSYLIAVIGV